MTDKPSPPEPNVAGVTVRYWAAARAAAGVESDVVPVESGTTLATVLDLVRALHRDRPRLADVVSVCSVLVGDRPVGKTDPAEVPLEPGDTVELLPPFAGG
ncbi:MAG: sulfur-carrier protein [Nocardioidaceae bacterium]|jgi:molybdopterin converting factor small subunit|nr:sulfur-carrier protein [Nocardioidaceae bacterium]